MLKPEILSPAGSGASVIAAVNSGCDAVFIGGNAFNARRFADSPSDEELKEIIKQCHLRGVKVHITVNTLYKDSELNDVLAFASKMYSYGADAYIIQDLGFFSLIKGVLPDIEKHASTQLTAHSLSQAKTLKAMGFDRIVLSRELPLTEIKNITANAEVATEIFAHGALCVSYSGRCLMSSMLGGRSGNRGSCAQPCRMEYRLISDGKELANGYLLSPKDNCTLPFAKDLLNANATSWKLEGRMKSPEYVSLITGMYRKYADNPITPTEEDMKRLTQIFNRGGELGSGYYFSHSGKSMLSTSPKSTGIYIGRVSSVKGKSCTIKLCENLSCGDGIEIWTKGEHTGTNISKTARAGESITLNINGRVQKGDLVYKSYDKGLIDSLKNSYNGYTRRSHVKAELFVQIGSPLRLTLTSEDGVAITAVGAVPEAPQKNSMSYGDLSTQLAKTGNTPFILDFESGSCEEVYVPLSSLKELKRTACEMLENAIDKHFLRTAEYTTYTPKKTEKADNTRLTVQVYTNEQLETALTFDNIDIYCELNEQNVKNAEYLIERAHNNSSKIYFALPVIERQGLHDFVCDSLARLEDTAIDGYLVRNIQNYDTQKPLVADYTLNTFNSASLALLKNKFKRVALSPELNLNELKPLCGVGTEVVVYGRLPLMTTQQCPVGVHIADKGEKPYCKLRNTHPACVLKDRKNVEFPVITMCDSCVALIMNSTPLFTADKWSDIAELKNEAVRLVFTVEDAEQTSKIIAMHKDLIAGNKINCKQENITRGHFYRGVL